MKSFKRILGIVALPMVALSFVGCGDATNLGQNVQLILDPASQSAKLEVEMTNGLQVSAAGSYLIQNNWGHLYFVDATKTTNAKIGIEVSLAEILKHQLNFALLNSLPNGAPLPVAVTPPVLGIPVVKNSNFDFKAVLSLTPELQLGALVGISAFSTKYVIPGVAICQNFRNSEKAAYAAVCIYGPSANSSESGGVFIGGTFGNVIPADMIASSTPIATNLAMRSSVFALSSKASESNFSGLNLPAMNISSNQFEDSIHDPKKQVFTSQGAKSLKNVKNVLKVRN